MPGMQGRPFSTELPVGRYAYIRGFTLKELSTVTGIYNRTMSDYIAGRKVIPPHHLAVLASALNVKESELVPESSQLL